VSGDFAGGQALVLDALALVERTDALTHHGEMLLEVAQVLRCGNRPTEAVQRIEQAQALFLQKENALSTRRARSLLAEVTVA